MAGKKKSKKTQPKNLTKKVKKIKLDDMAVSRGGAETKGGFMHMAAGTQDAMKRVLFGAAGVTKDDVTATFNTGSVE